MGTLGKVILGIILGLIIVWMVVPHSAQSPAQTSASAKNTPVQVYRYDPSAVSPTATMSFVASMEEQKRKNIAQAIDYGSRTTINFARSHIQNSNSGDYNLAQVCDLWDYAYRNWHYVNDPQGMDYFSSASNTISISLKGDCDDYAILVAALVEAIGGTSRVVTASDSDGNYHAFAEVYISDSEKDVDRVSDYIKNRYPGVDGIRYSYETDSSGTTHYWLNLDWWANHPGGPYKANTNRASYYSSDMQFVPLSIPTNYKTVSTLPTSNIESESLVSKNLVVPTGNVLQTQPTISLYPLSVTKEGFINIPYGNIRTYTLDGLFGNIYTITVSATAPVDVLVLDQTNYDTYYLAFQLDSTPTFHLKEKFLKVTSKEFTYILPSTGGPYHLVIENARYLTNGADAQEDVIASVKIDVTGKL